MHKKEIYIQSLEELPQRAKDFFDIVGKERIFAFKGKMGAGKTTFIKALCEQLGVEDNVCSPTFAIVNVYFSNKVGDVYHFDFYRLDNEAQALDIGVEEYFYSGNYCFMEWAENIPYLIPDNCIEVEIEETTSKTRKITIHLPY